MEPQQKSKGLKWAVIIGIIIVLNLFFNYALSLVYTSPDYETYCPNLQVNNQPTTKAACLSIGGQWNESVAPQQKQFQPASQALRPISPPSQPEVVLSCNPTYTCQKNFNSAQKTYDKNVFITLIVLGVLSIVIGMFVKMTDAVSLGLSFGGVLSFVIASMRYWSQAQNLLKVTILAVALAALIWVGIKKFQE